MSRKLFILTICLFLGACNLPGQPSVQDTAGPQAWFDMPLPDSVFFPLDACQVVAHGPSPDGIAVFEFFINNSLSAKVPSPDPRQTLATIDTVCPPLVPGKNITGVRVQDNAGNWSETAHTHVFRADDIYVNQSPADGATLTPASASDAVVTIERVSTHLVYLGDSTCGPQEVNIVARVIAPKGIKLVLLFYRFATGNASTEYKNEGMPSIGGDLYARTLNPASLLGGALPFDAATLQYQIVVQQDDGDVSLRTPVLSDISVKACGGNPPSSGGGGGTVVPACSAYTDERSCIEHGCSWVLVPGLVPIYECRNP